jgi:hypothetical protein
MLGFWRNTARTNAARSSVGACESRSIDEFDVVDRESSDDSERSYAACKRPYEAVPAVVAHPNGAAIQTSESKRKWIMEPPSRHRGGEHRSDMGNGNDAATRHRPTSGHSLARVCDTRSGVRERVQRGDLALEDHVRIEQCRRNNGGPATGGARASRGSVTPPRSRGEN